MFTWSENELNAEQSEAVRTPGSVFLMACPGSGKTRALTYKIAYDLSRPECDKKFVVAITYTNRAADEIRERIEGLGVETSKLWIGTIHSFCLEWIIRPYGIYEPELAAGFRVIDQHEREKILDRLCAPHQRPRISHFDCDYYFDDDGYYLGCQDATKHAAIRQVLQQYFLELNERKSIDFELILWHASRLIRNKPAICAILSKLFSIILVDEYQDTKQIQYSILCGILRAGGGNTRLFMVGDPNQAIYGSLGGFPIEVGALRELCGFPIAERDLSLNYRSSARIVDYFGNFNVHNTRIRAEGRNQAYPSVVTYNRHSSRDDLVNEIGNLIRHSVENIGIPAHEICVLAPQWFPLASMTRQLVASMPGYEFDGPGMVPFARDTENFWYKVSRLALTEPSPSQYVRRLRWAGEVIEGLSEAGVDTSHFTRKLLLRECNSIRINEGNGLNYLGLFFDGLFERLEIDYEVLVPLLEHHTAFFESSLSRIERLRADGIENVDNVSFFRRCFQNRSGVTVSTIHGVKGAEFDVVIAFGLLEGMVPHFNDPDGEMSACKLLYVIGSRARKNLHLFSETDRPRGRYKVYGPTLRLARCAFAYN